MRVKDLIEHLKNLPEDRLVVLQKDGEGNGYSPLATVDPSCVYVAETTWGGEGEVYPLDWSAEDAEMSEAEWAVVRKGGVDCVVLVPTN